MKAKFEISVTVFMLLVGSLVLYSHGRTYLRERALYLHSGDRLPALKDINWGNYDRTLLLVLRNGCHYCDDSMPFYRKIATLSATQHKAFVTAVVPDDAKPEQQLFRVYRIDIPIIGNVPFGKLKITGTPTLLLVDSQGKVQKIWVGQLTPAGESDVLAAVGGERRAAEVSRR